MIALKMPFNQLKAAYVMLIINIYPSLVGDWIQLIIHIVHNIVVSKYINVSENGW